MASTDPATVSASEIAVPNGRFQRVLNGIHRRIDNANPMLVRCVRQELRSRTFLGVFNLLLLVSTVSALVAALWAAPSSVNNSQQVGRGLFGVLAVAWSCALVVVQGTSTFRAVTQERSDDTWDLVDLTGMGPRKILRGLLAANLVQGALYTAPIAPFLVMAYLLRGLDLVTILFSLIIVPLAGIAASSLAVLCATLGNQKATRTSLGGLLGLGLLGAWLMSFTIWFAPMGGIDYFLSELGRGDFLAWSSLVAMLDVWACFVAVTLVLSGVLMSHPSANRSTAPRLLMLILWLNGALWAFVFPILVALIERHVTVTSIISLSASIFAICAIFCIILVGAFAITEDFEITDRQARSLKGSRIKRIAMIFLGPGASRGRLFTIALSLLTLGISGFVVITNDYSYSSSDNPSENWWFAWFALCYAAILFVIGDLLGRGIFRKVFPTPTLRRVLLLVSLLAWGWVPLIVGLALNDISFNESIASIVSPLSGAPLLAYHGEMHEVGRLTVSLGGIAALLLLGFQGSRLAVIKRKVLATQTDHNPRG